MEELQEQQEQQHQQQQQQQEEALLDRSDPALTRPCVRQEGSREVWRWYCRAVSLPITVGGISISIDDLSATDTERGDPRHDHTEDIKLKSM